MLREHTPRLTAAHQLAQAIADCHPEDAVVLLAAALEDLAVGEPPIYLLDLEAEAADWATFASPLELEVYYVAIQRRISSLPSRRRNTASRAATPL